MATNGNMNFSGNPEISNGITGMIESKLVQKKFANDYWKDNGHLSEAIKEVEQMTKSYEKMASYSNKMTKTEMAAIEKKKAELKIQLDYLNKIKNTQTVSNKKAIESILKTNKLLEQGQKKYYELMTRFKSKEGAMTKAQIRDLNAAIAKYEDIRDLSEDIHEEFKGVEKILNSSPTSWTGAMAKTAKSIGDDLRNLSNMFSLSKIASNSIEQYARSNISIMNNINKQFGFTQSGQFDKFKSSLDSTLTQMNSSMGNRFNSGDMRTYLQSLADMGISNSKMAEQQMKNSILATKYLGVSNETQSEIFKFMKLTNNNTMLENHNKTIVGILKSQLGVSKESLDALSQVAYGSSNSKSALGMSADAITAQSEALTLAGSALTSMYDKDTASSIISAYNDFITNPGSASWQSILGNKYTGLYNSGFSSTSTEAQSNAFNQWLEAMQGSKLFNSSSGNNLGTAVGNSYLNNVSALGDDVIMALKTFDETKYINLQQQALAGALGASSDDIDSFINDTTEITILEKIQNWLDTFINKIDWKHTINLANAAFAAYALYGGLKLFSSIGGIFNALGGTKALTGSGGIAGQISLFNNGKTTTGAGLSKLGAGLAVVGLTAAATSAIGRAATNAYQESAASNYGEQLANLKGTKLEGNKTLATANSIAEATNSMTGFGSDMAGFGQAVGYGWSKLFTNDKNTLNASLSDWMYNGAIFKDGKALVAWLMLMDQVGSLDAVNNKLGTSFTRSEIKQVFESDRTGIFQNINSILRGGWYPYTDNNGGRLKSYDDYIDFWDSNENDGYHKAGKNYIPKDNYKALLHKGEMVLTADEADLYRQITRGGRYGMGGQADTLYQQYVNEGKRGQLLTNLPWTMTAGYVRYPTLNGIHRGLDFGIGEGTKIGAAYSGVVDSVTSGYGGGWGNSVYVKGDNGIYYRYAHLSSTSLSAGDRVAAGQLIGLSGNTGNSSGPHLHFQTDNPKFSDINPYGYITNSLFQATGNISTGVSPTSGTEGSLSSSNSRRLIPSALLNKTSGTGGAEIVANSVDNGISKILNYLEGVRTEQAEQRKLINAFSKARSSELTF